MLPVFTKCDCQLVKSGGIHIRGCPMNPNCSFCELPPLTCQMMKRCGGIQKTAQFFADADKKREAIKVKISNKKKDLVLDLNCLINHGAVSDVLEARIDH